MESARTMELMPVTKKGIKHISISQHNLAYSNTNTISQPKNASDLTNYTTNRERIFKGYGRNFLTSPLNFQFLTFFSLLIIMLLSISVEVNGSPFIMSNCLLNPNLAVDPDEAKNCKFGYEVDACGTYFCSKGPKSYCGGKFERYGVCGEGLMCNKCNRCTGCSTKTFQCWYDDNCIWSSD